MALVAAALTVNVLRALTVPPLFHWRALALTHQWWKRERRWTRRDKDDNAIRRQRKGKKWASMGFSQPSFPNGGNLLSWGLSINHYWKQSLTLYSILGLYRILLWLFAYWFPLTLTAVLNLFWHLFLLVSFKTYVYCADCQSSVASFVFWPWLNNFRCVLEDLSS